MYRVRAQRAQDTDETNEVKLDCVAVVFDTFFLQADTDGRPQEKLSSLKMHFFPMFIDCKKNLETAPMEYNLVVTSAPDLIRSPSTG